MIWIMGLEVITMTKRRAQPVAEMQARVLATIDECLSVALGALAAPMRPSGPTLTQRVMRDGHAVMLTCGFVVVELRGFDP